MFRYGFRIFDMVVSLVGLDSKIHAHHPKINLCLINKLNRMCKICFYFPKRCSIFAFSLVRRSARSSLVALYDTVA